MVIDTDISPAAGAIDKDKHRLRLWLRLLKISRTIEAELRERLRVNYNSTLPRFDVLAALYRQNEGFKMSELSAALMVSNGNVTGIIERLVSENLVARTPIPGDRRAMRVRLTTKGRDDFAHMAEVHQGWVSELLEDVSDEDAKLITSMLDVKILAGRSTKEGK